jgi:hypothetical protein
MYKDEHVPHQLLLTRVRRGVQALLRIQGVIWIQ